MMMLDTDFHIGEGQVLKCLCKEHKIMDFKDELLLFNTQLKGIDYTSQVISKCCICGKPTSYEVMFDQMLYSCCRDTCEYKVISTLLFQSLCSRGIILNRLFWNPLRNTYHLSQVCDFIYKSGWELAVSQIFIETFTWFCTLRKRNDTSNLISCMDSDMAASICRCCVSVLLLEDRLQKEKEVKKNEENT